MSANKRLRNLAWAVHIALMGTVLSYQGCAGFDSSSPVPDSSSLSSNGNGSIPGQQQNSYSGCVVSELQIAFQESYYPFVTANCTKCHGDAGPQVPFASASLNTAFNTFYNVESGSSLASIMNANAVNSQHGNGQSGNGPQLQNAVTQASNTWLADSAAACTGGVVGQPPVIEVDFMAAAKSVQTKNTQDVQPKTLVWNFPTDITNVLNSIAGYTEASALGTATLNLTLTQVVGPPSGYQIANPTLTTGNVPAIVHSILVYFNGVEFTQGTTFSNIDVAVPAKTSNQVLVQNAMFLQVPTATSDQISIEVLLDE